MKFFKQWAELMVMGARAHARWELDVSTTILGSKKRLLILALLCVPVVLGGIAFADEIAGALPALLGGKKAYSPAFYSTGIFLVSIAIGIGAGLITGCIGAGGGFIIAPALMSAGIKGIMAVGTDLFHIFAKAIMGSVIHRKLGNVSVPLAVVFLIGAIIGATGGGLINRGLYELNPLLSDAFITIVYSLMLGFLGVYALSDFLIARRAAKREKSFHGMGAHAKVEGAEMGNLPRRLQSVKLPPIVRFDYHLVPGGRGISWVFLVASGALVGLAAGIMGVGGGFLTFPIFVYVLGVSSMTTVGTDIFQIVFTAGYASISQYAIFGFISYTLAMGMLLGSLLGIQIGAMATKVVPGITIRGFYAMAVLAGAVNRIFALPSKMASMGWIPLSRKAGAVLDTIGIWAFFIVIGIFAVWVIGTFLTNIGKLKGGERKHKIADKKKFMIGLISLLAFFVVLVILFSPVFRGKNGLEYLDNLYNSISKGSAYYIPETRAKAGHFNGTAVNVTLKMAGTEQAGQTALLFTKSGATAQVSEAEIKVSGDLGKILENCLDDADSIYFNDGAKVSGKYGYGEHQVMLNWWNALNAMDKDLSKLEHFKEAKIVSTVREKAVEPGYNYYQIEPQKISDRFGVVIFSLIFYVAYTLWYGFAILYMFEGWGLKLEH